MRILTNTYPWALHKHNRERKVHKDITRLGNQFSDMEFYLVDSMVSMLLGNALYAIHNGSDRLLRSLPFKRLHPMGPFWYDLSRSANYIPKGFVLDRRFDLLFAHEYFPVNLSEESLPIVYETKVPSDECILSYRSRYMVNLPRANEYRSKMNRVFGKRSTLMILTTPGDAERLTQELPEFTDKIRIVPWYTPDIEAINHELVLKKHLRTEQSIKILFVGNDAQRKGLPELLKAFNQLSEEERSKIDINIVTNFHDGKIRISDERIRVLSDIPNTEVQRIMSESHVFVLPTKGDTYGLVIPEAMAAGCAVISSRREPQDWLLDMGKSGLLVEPTQPDSISDAMKILINNHDTRREFAMKAYDRFISVLHPEVVGSQYRDVFYEAIEKWQQVPGRRPGTSS